MSSISICREFKRFLIVKKIFIIVIHYDHLQPKLLFQVFFVNSKIPSLNLQTDMLLIKIYALLPKLLTFIIF